VLFTYDAPVASAVGRRKRYSKRRRPAPVDADQAVRRVHRASPFSNYRRCRIVVRAATTGPSRGFLNVFAVRSSSVRLRDASSFRTHAETLRTRALIARSTRANFSPAKSARITPLLSFASPVRGVSTLVGRWRFGRVFGSIPVQETDCGGGTRADFIVWAGFFLPTSWG